MKKITLFILGVFSSIGMVSAQTQWTPTSIPPGGSVWALATIGTTIFAGTASGGVYFSADEGATWEQRNGDFPEMRVYSLAVSGTDVFVGTGGSFGAGIYKSSDNGLHWTNITPVSMPVSSNVRSLAISPTNIYAGTFGGNGIFKSSLSDIDSSTWETFNTGLTNLNINTLQIKGTTIYAGTYGNGVWIYETNDTGWNITSLTMADSADYIRALDVTGSTIFAGNISATPVLYRSTDNGINWVQSNTDIFYNKPIYSIFNDGSNVYAGTEGVGVLTSNDNGITWSEYNDGFKDSLGNWLCVQINVRSFALNAGTLYAGTDCGVWKRSSLPLTTNELKIDDQFTFYPNPATEIINVKVKPGLLGTNYKISDLLGRTVLIGKITNETSNILVHDLKPGMYIYSFETSKPQKFKFLKE